MIWKTVKIPEWAYENALLAKGDVLVRSAAALPVELLSPAKCPRCDSELELVRVGYERVQCTQCNYKQERFEASSTNLRGIGIGVLLGLGLAALFRSESRPVDTRRTVRAQAIRRRAARSGRSPTAREIQDEITATRKSRRKRTA
jgi:transposase-like protein